MTSNEIQEVVSFLSDPKGSVRLAATEILSGLVETEAFKNGYLGAEDECPSRRKFVCQKVVRLIGDTEASEAAVKLLACLSAYTDFANDIVACNGVSRTAENLMELLRSAASKPEKHAGTGGMHNGNRHTDKNTGNNNLEVADDAEVHIEMSVVLLANLTRMEIGRKHFLKKDNFSENEIDNTAPTSHHHHSVEEIPVEDDHHPLRGAILMKIFGEFLEQPGLSRIGKPQAADSRSVMGSVLANLLVQPCVRKFIAELGVDVINRLSYFVLYKLRRPTVLHILKQLACDTTLHATLFADTIPCTGDNTTANTTCTGDNTTDMPAGPSVTLASHFIPHVCCCVYPSKCSGLRTTAGPKAHEVFSKGGLMVDADTTRSATAAAGGAAGSATGSGDGSATAAAGGAAGSAAGSGAGSGDGSATAPAGGDDGDSGAGGGAGATIGGATAATATGGGGTDDDGAAAVCGDGGGCRDLHDLVDAFAFGPVASVEERSDVYDILMQLCTTAIGRDALRKQHAYEVFRVWHLIETNEDIKTKIEDIVHLVVYSEEELAQQDAQRNR